MEKSHEVAQGAQAGDETNIQAYQRGWNDRAALATQPAAGEPPSQTKGRIPHHVYKGTNVLPCYCWASGDHWIGKEVDAPPAAAHGDELYTAQARLSEALSLLRKVDENGEGLYRSLHEDIQSFLAGHPAAHGDEAVRKDAERYRWISANVTEAEIGRSSEFHTDWRRAWKLPLLLSQNAVAATFTFDEAIDAAMRAQAGEGGEV